MQIEKDLKCREKGSVEQCDADDVQPAGFNPAWLRRGPLMLGCYFPIWYRAADTASIFSVRSFATRVAFFLISDVG